MELKIDNDVIAAAVNDETKSAVTRAMKSYSVEKSISEALASELADGSIAKVVQSAVESMDNKALVARLASEIEKATTRTVVMLLEDGLTRIIGNIRGLKDFSSTYDADMAKIRAEVRNRRNDQSTTNDKG